MFKTGFNHAELGEWVVWGRRTVGDFEEYLGTFQDKVEAEVFRTKALDLGWVDVRIAYY